VVSGQTASVIVIDLYTNNAAHSVTKSRKEKQRMFKVAVSTYALEKKIPQGSPFWKKFNGSFENRELTPLELATAIQEGRAFTTWHKDNWRSGANFLLGQHVALDFDTGRSDSSIPSLLQSSFISRYAGILYTTSSHREDAPRARVVFLLDKPIHYAENYAQVASALVWTFERADRQCTDPCRSWYGSKGCEYTLRDNVLPVTVARQLAYQYQKATARPEHVYDGDPADFGEAADALLHIPARGIAYDEWVKVLMALYRGFGNEALPLAESWADGKPGEVQTKWKSFGDGNATGTVNVNTLFYIAKQFGWQKGT